MIGMNILGQNGRLGNQMFQYSALVGISKNMGYDYCIPNHSNAINFGSALSTHHQLHHCFEMIHHNNRFGYIDGDEVELHQYEFCEELFNECPDNVTLKGYFETEKYFQNAEKEIRKDFTFKTTIIDEVNDIFSEHLKKDPVSIVVRRFSDSYDYYGVENNHYNLPLAYYEKSISMLGKDRTYIICSNDVEWCKEQTIFKRDNFIINDFDSKNIMKGHFDLCLISSCKDHIIANSSFSWWGAWLSKNKNKTVFAPEVWFGKNQSSLNTKDLIPNNWNKITF
jgi:hypothetical protein